MADIYLYYIIPISIIILVLVAVIIFLKHNIKTIERYQDIRMHQYEESTQKLLEQMQRQYEERIAGMEQHLDTRQNEIEDRMEKRENDMRQRANMEFSSLASETLARESEHFRRTNRDELDIILTPLRQYLNEFRKTISDNLIEDHASRVALAKQMETLSKANAEITNEARRLSNTLRGDTRSQGLWGESVLKRILESAGMIEGTNFITQSSTIEGSVLRSDEGSTLRPDCIILLPGNLKVVVDSKTSLTDYIRYIEGTDDQQTKNHLKKHLDSVRKHIKELSNKQYHRRIEGALEHTLMFIPNEGAFISALEADSAVCEFAYANNVVIVSPTHILSVIQLIGQMWRVERQNRNAEAIAEAGGKLYDRFASFLTDFEKIERNLQLSLKAYETCKNHIAGGSRSLSARAERLRQMGAKTSRRIPEVWTSGDLEQKTHTGQLSSETRSEEE